MQQNRPIELMPIGGGYDETIPSFIESSLNHTISSTVRILVLPLSYASNPVEISEDERIENLSLAEGRRSQVAEVCNEIVQSPMKCEVMLAPVLTRSDAENLGIDYYFTDDLTAVYILGGDQATAMQVIRDTPLEAALADAYARGVLVAGTSAGSAIQSLTMLSGYNPAFNELNSLHFGAVDLWVPPEKRGLPFGIDTAIIDQHFYQHSRLGRLLNAIANPDARHIGIGIDVDTGLNITNGSSLDRVFGLNTVTILDADTYHAAESVKYRGDNHLLSLRNVILHLFSPGVYDFDLESRTSSLDMLPEQMERKFDGLLTPNGAGALIVSGKISEPAKENPILERFVELSGGDHSNILIIATSYPTTKDAQAAIQFYQDAIAMPVQSLIISTEFTKALELPSDATGILLISADQAIVPINQLPDIGSPWRSGTPVMAIDAAAAILGKYYVDDPAISVNTEDAAQTVQDSFIQGNTIISPGLSLINVILVPNIVGETRWADWFTLGYSFPELLALGITENTAIELNQDRSYVLGEEVVFALDLSNAVLSLGKNNGYVIVNGMLDVFASGDSIVPGRADINFSPVQEATPDLSTTPNTPTFTQTASTLTPGLLSASTPTPSQTTPEKPPTRTPRPTATPPDIPPPADPAKANLMIAFSILAVIVVLIGVWINRQRIN
jgi:cyanophycinase